ncbi:hypothetical protein HN51_064429 [Arachis hypogaea]|uniref:uncharacterized protein LOC107643643 n=1 Tax=Arachis ipaensis TaxID=130454 RepID=UPI0007AF58F6|nr:uncharacterized protein LOC107643643 [Arachis ipaensis]
MPLAMGSDAGVTIERSSFVNCASICDRDFPEEEEESDASSSSSSSSIGRNSGSSEDSSDREDSGETEVQSSFKGPLDTMNDLEQDLPVKKGISKFYSGKSKSFTSLADAISVTSVQEIVKPEDPYAKKRKNLLARNLLIERSRSSDNFGGMLKRKSNIRRGPSCLTLSSSEEGNSSASTSISPPFPLPPLHPQAKKSSANAPQPCPPVRNSPWRSYSWSDLQSAAETHDLPSLAICSGNKGNKVH